MPNLLRFGRFLARSQPFDASGERPLDSVIQRDHRWSGHSTPTPRLTSSQWNLHTRSASVWDRPSRALSGSPGKILTPVGRYLQATARGIDGTLPDRPCGSRERMQREAIAARCLPWSCPRNHRPARAGFRSKHCDCRLRPAHVHAGVRSRQRVNRSGSEPDGWRRAWKWVRAVSVLSESSRLRST